MTKELFPLIWCSLQDAGSQLPKTERFAQALKWLQTATQKGNDVSQWLQAASPNNSQRIEIAGDELYASLICYESVAGMPAKLEAHRKYIDIQYTFAGEEGIAVADQAGLPCQTQYDANKDVEFFSATEVITLPQKAGYLAVLFPEDAHAAQMALHQPQRVAKIVIKVLCD